MDLAVNNLSDVEMVAEDELNIGVDEKKEFVIFSNEKDMLQHQKDLRVLLSGQKDIIITDQKDLRIIFSDQKDFSTILGDQKDLSVVLSNEKDLIFSNQKDLSINDGKDFIELSDAKNLMVVSDGKELVIDQKNLLLSQEDDLDVVLTDENDLGVVLSDESVLVNSTFSGPSIVLTEAPDTGALNVSHYLLPHNIAENASNDLPTTTWESITTTNTASTSLNQDSGIESDANPDVFLAFVDDNDGPLTLLTSVPSDEEVKPSIIDRESEKGINYVQVKNDVIFRYTDVQNDVMLSSNNEQCTTDKDTQIKLAHPHVVKVLLKSEKDFVLMDSCDSSSKDDDMTFKEDKLFTEDEFLQDYKKDPLGSDEEERIVLIDTANLQETLNESLTTTTLYRCADCNSTFCSHSSFKAHMEEHLVRLQNSCALCNREFDTKTQLQDHIKEHFEKPALIPCDLCNKSFISKQVLRKHIRQKHLFYNEKCFDPPLSYKCDVCSSVFSTKISLKSHSATHSTRKPYQCKECGATFTQNGSLQVHLRRHKGEKPFACHKCGNTFTRAHSLKVHMRSHTGEKAYACEWCSASFVTSSHLTVHKRTHTGERPYACTNCGATFITTSHLNVHKRLHTPVFPHPNLKQEQKVSSLEIKDKNSSLKLLTGSPKSVYCKFCCAFFDDLGQLRHHRRMQHKGLEKRNKSLIETKSQNHELGIENENGQQSENLNKNGAEMEEEEGENDREIQENHENAEEIHQIDENVDEIEPAYEKSILRIEVNTQFNSCNNGEKILVVNANGVS